MLSWQWIQTSCFCKWTAVCNWVSHPVRSNEARAGIIKAGGMIVEPCSRPERRLPKMRVMRYVAMNSRIAGANFGQLVNRPVSVPAITPIER
jgi:hypothetical protein